jgi:deoxycytidine triphosphate deaminase
MRTTSTARGCVPSRYAKSKIYSESTSVYLTDTELHRRLDDLGIEPENDHPNFRFDADSQIGPCSIDLRLSCVYWKRRGRRGSTPAPLVLDQAHLMELSPSRGWERREIEPTERITLRPGEMILARIAERLRVPSDCAARIEARSSYSRLGLDIAASGNFINPGWEGHMPMVIVNHSSVTIKIPAGAPIVQLVLVQLAAAPALDYSKRHDRLYHSDFGGPSLWWRDEKMKRIRDELNAASIHVRVFDEIDELLQEAEDDDFLSRLEAFVNAGGVQAGNSADLLDAFAESEEKLAKRQQIGHFVARWIVWTVGLALAIFILSTDLAVLPKTILTIVAVAPGVAALVWVLGRDEGYFLTHRTLRGVRRRASARQ